jgi:hypothetical protein
MSVRKQCAIGLLVVSAAGAQTRPRTPQVVNIRPAAANIKNAVVTPQPLQFLSSDPDSRPVAGNSPATISWEIAGAQSTGRWTLTVQTGAASFSGCGAVPAAAVTAQCVSVTGGGQGGSGTCAAPLQLSAHPGTLAVGSQGQGNSWLTVTVNFTFQDGWPYIAAMNPPCTLNLSYIIQTS